MKATGHPPASQELSLTEAARHYQQRRLSPDSLRAKKRVGAHALTQRQIQASAPWQYRLPADGRKWQVQSRRRHLVALYIAGFPTFYMAVDTLAKRLDDDKVGGFTWSRRTVCVILRDLARLCVLTPSGYMSARGTRLRVLHPEALLAKRESCTPAHRESCTQEVPRNLELKRYSDTGKTANSAVCQPLTSFKSKKQEKPKPTTYNVLDVLNALTRYYGPSLAPGLYFHIDGRIAAARGMDPDSNSTSYWPLSVRYWIRAAQNLFAQYEEHIAIAIATKWEFASNSRIFWNEHTEKWEWIRR